MVALSATRGASRASNYLFESNPMSSHFRHMCAALLLASLSSACVLAVGTDTAEHRSKLAATDGSAAATTSQTDVVAAGASVDGKDKQPAPDSEAGKKKAARKAEKKAREVTYAHMEKALADMDAANDLRDANFELEHARHELEAAQKELEHYQKLERPLDLEDSQIDLDRGSESALERKQELDELISMYKKDEYAKMTKELVLQRGKFTLELAQREVELSKKKAADKKEHAMAVKERDLSLALAKAQESLTAAEAKLKKTQAHSELELLRARHKVEDAERVDDDEEPSGGASKGA